MSSLEAAAHSPEELRMTEEDSEHEFELVAPEDNDQWNSDLPRSYSELLDEHFPLFITYDQVRMSLSSN